MKEGSRQIGCSLFTMYKVYFADLFLFVILHGRTGRRFFEPLLSGTVCSRTAFPQLVCRALCQRFLLVLDFPVDEEGQNTAQQDDRAEYKEFIPVPGNDGPKDLPAQLEFKCEGDSLGQIEPDKMVFPGPGNEAADCRIDQDEYAEEFQNCDAELDDICQNFLQNCDKTSHDASRMCAENLITV